jgi:proteasome lid subunit RPN8/RPN11
MKKEIDGLIIGWYHSHPGYGIFMSDTDIQTQSRFQQFSDNVVALVL